MINESAAEQKSLLEEEAAVLAQAGAEEVSAEAGGRAAVSAGQLLRQARERAQMHTEVLAGILKVPVRRIEALEADTLDALPDLTFARALTASICRHLKTDPAPILALLPQINMRPPQEPDVLEKGAVLTAPTFRSPTWLALMKLGKWVLGLGLPLFLAFLIFALWRTHGREAEERSAAELAHTSSASASVPASGGLVDKATGAASGVAAAHAAASVALGGASAAAPMRSASAAVPSAAASARPSSASASSPASSAAGTRGNVPTNLPALVAPLQVLPAAGAASGAAAQAVTAAPTAPTATSITAATLQLASTDRAWVQVSDARRKILLSRTLQAGESAVVQGALPYHVVMGRAEVVQLSLGGKPVAFLKPGQIGVVNLTLPQVTP